MVSLHAVPSVEEHAKFESLARNRISNMSFTICSVGEVLILAVMVGILKGLHSDASTENNTKAFSVLIAFSGGVWRTCLDCHVPCAIPADIGRALIGDSALRAPMVFPGEAARWTRAPARHVAIDDRIQTDVCGAA